MHARTRLSVRASRNARMAGALGSWPLTTTLRGMRSELRLLLIVVTIALLASTIITSFALLVVATEQGGVRAALASVDPAQSTLDIQALGPNQTVRQTRERADKAIRSVMGDAAPVRGVGFAISDPVAAPGRDATMETVGYFGELDQVRDHATITDGAWAGLTPPGQPVAVTLPRTAAKSLGLKVGSVFRVQASNAPLDVVVAGLYTVRDPRGDYWGRDRLQGRGDVVGFPKEAVTVFVPTHAFGPLLVPAGAMDAAQIPVRSIDIRYAPDFGNTRVDQIAPLADRLATSDQDVPAAMGLAARSIDYSTHLADVLADVSTSLVVTRSTVVVVSLLLLVLSISALTQTARLFSDARAGERRLMRARGASSGQLITLSVFEALAIGLTCAIASPFLAELVYSALAAQPAMVASGMPRLAGLTGQVWFVAGGVAAIFVVVLIAPSLRRAELFVDNDQTKGRAPRGSSLLRSGLDLGLVVLAVVAVWQLQSYKTPVNG
ncbi:MAG: hypothetical protein QOI02_462, partial [Actinomycetota bacterium]|nr:hypothetical protein [Actinomycetota bacterium]